MMTLYHGSNVRITEIDLSLSKKGKDFGSGFYLNPDKNQAFKMAMRTSLISSYGIPVVNAFLFDDSVLTNSDLRVKTFEDYSEEWVKFVLLNRKNKSATPAHPYDIVIGPIADDTVGVQIRRFTEGYIDTERLIEELRFKGSKAIQYFFGTEKAISYLKPVIR